MKIIPISFALLAIGLCACQPKPAASSPKNNLDSAPTKTTRVPVQTVTAQSGTLKVQRVASGIIEAQRDSQVASQSSGTVQSILVQVGQRVAGGQVILRLDDTAQRQAVENASLQVQQAQVSLQQTQTTTQQATAALQASLSSAEAAFAQAQQQARSQEQLLRIGGTSASQVQAARSQLAQAQSQLAQAHNALAQNGRSAQSSVPLQRVQLASAQASLRQARENLARTVVRAPFAGVVAELKVEVGEFAATGTPLFRLVDPGSLRVKLRVPTSDAATLSAGTTFNLSYGGTNYVATVVGSPGVAASDRLVPITARIEGGEHLPVGGSAQARYNVVLGQGTLLPSGSLQLENGENVVYLAQGQQARRQVVQVVAEAAGQVSVQGLSAGSKVVSPVPAGLQDGAALQVGP